MQHDVVGIGETDVALGLHLIPKVLLCFHIFRHYEFKSLFHLFSMFYIIVLNDVRWPMSDGSSKSSFQAQALFSNNLHFKAFPA